MLSLTDVRNVEDTLKRLKLPRKFHKVTDVNNLFPFFNDCARFEEEMTSVFSWLSGKLVNPYRSDSGILTACCIIKGWLLQKHPLKIAQAIKYGDDLGSRFSRNCTKYSFFITNYRSL